MAFQSALRLLCRPDRDILLFPAYAFPDDSLRDTGGLGPMQHASCDRPGMAQQSRYHACHDVFRLSNW